MQGHLRAQACYGAHWRDIGKPRPTLPKPQSPVQIQGNCQAMLCIHLHDDGWAAPVFHQRPGAKDHDITRRWPFARSRVQSTAASGNEVTGQEPSHDSSGCRAFVGKRRCLMGVSCTVSQCLEILIRCIRFLLHGLLPRRSRRSHWRTGHRRQGQRWRRSRRTLLLLLLLLRGPGTMLRSLDHSFQTLLGLPILILIENADSRRQRL
mmetsp:Transcript_14718/g.32345  ORF Transcript_14718/g.32345 Transcript_14718/m.32345 type:complete len:207 (-) Transcript_14718:632-1252(-)